MKWPTFLRILSREPRRGWPEGALHHGLRALLLVILAAATTMFFPVAPLPDFPVLEKGMVAEEDVIAEMGYEIPLTEQELARARQDAAAAEKPIFVYQPNAAESMVARIDGFFARVDSAVAGAPSEAAARQRVRDLLTRSDLPPTDDDVGLLVDPDQRERLHQTVRNVVREELPRGIAAAGELAEAESDEVRLIGHGRDRTVPVDSLRTALDFFDRARFYLPRTAPPGYAQLQRLLLVRFLEPSIQADWTATEAARTRAMAAVSTTKGEVLEGERIVTARERVGAEEIERLRAYQQALAARGQLSGGLQTVRAAGLFIFNLLVLALFGTLLYFYRRPVYRDARQVTLLFVLIASLLVTAAVIARYDATTALIPIAFPALVVATLWDGRLALNLALILAVLLAGQTPFLGIEALATLVTGGAVASLSVRVVRRRAQAWVFIALIAGAYLLVSVMLGLLMTWPVRDVAIFAGWGLLNAVASAFAAMGFLPVFESYTRITTDQTLLELADANRPLLRRLSMEAPGTYAHSINVANLSEAAAGAIGANALLTRVGVYYHDVGKIAKPHYFIENQPGGRNPHDRLKPSQSAQVVRNHVVEGLKLAEAEKLPDCVKAFIVEHHGTQSISFFYDQACDADPESPPNRKDFEYPGPRPQSQETAIVMLADSVESAARVLPDPTHENIRQLVDRIVQAKIDAGQLDETPLTLAELSLIKEQFVNVLAGMYHQRIDYPPARGDQAESPDGGGTQSAAPERAGDPHPTGAGAG